MDAAYEEVLLHGVPFGLNKPFQLRNGEDRKYYTVALEEAQWMHLDSMYVLYFLEFDDDDAHMLRPRAERWRVLASDVAAPGAARGLETPSSTRAGLPFDADDLRAACSSCATLQPRRRAASGSMPRKDREVSLWRGFPHSDKVKLNEALYALSDVQSSIADHRIELSAREKMKLERTIKTLCRRTDFLIPLTQTAGGFTWHPFLSPHVTNDLAALVRAEERHYVPIVHQRIVESFSIGSAAVVENWDECVARSGLPHNARKPVLSAGRLLLPDECGLQLWANPGEGCNPAFLVARIPARNTEARFERVIERLMGETVRTGSVLFSTNATYVSERCVPRARPHKRVLTRYARTSCALSCFSDSRAR